MVEERKESQGNPIKVMVVTAHPDDAEFGCGGTIATWAAEGREIIYVICTNGDKGSSDLTMTSERLAVIREEEQRCAAAMLGVKEVIFLGYPDGSLEDSPGFRDKIVRLVRLHRPNIVITMEPNRKSIQHRDHRITGTVALDAVFPYARDHLSYPEHLAEGLMPHKVEEVLLTGSESPDFWVDITDNFSKKITALRCHVSQVGSTSEKDLEERMRNWAKWNGESQGMALAEAFRRIELRQWPPPRPGRP